MGPRLWAGGLNMLSLMQLLQLNCQALKRLLSGGSEAFCASCDSRRLRTGVGMLTGSGFGLLPTAYHGPAPAAGTVHGRPLETSPSRGSGAA